MFECKNCNSDKYKLCHDNLPDSFYGIAGKFSYGQCLNCGLFQIIEVPDDLYKYYKGYTLHLKDSAIYRLFRSLFLGKCYYLPKSHGEKLLDVGCGNGWYLDKMKNNGWNVFGLELDRQYAKELSRRLDVPILTADDLDNHVDFFDLITLYFSFEHVDRPRVLLDKLQRSLKKGGKIIFMLPNIQSAEHKLFMAKWFHLDPPRHISFYSKQLLVKTLSSLGFSDIIIKDIPIPTGFAGSISYLLFNKFVHWVWYLNILPGFIFSRIIRDGNFMLMAAKK